MATIDELVARVDQLKCQFRAAQASLAAAESALAEARAEELGVKVGSIVRVSGHIGFGSKRKAVVKRYRVSKIAPSWNMSGVKLIGITIRKDGKDGERHEIWQDWEVEAT